MSEMTYNNIKLPYAYTSRYEQTPERDELGNVDPYLTKFDISVQCILNKTFLAYIAPTFAAGGVVPTNSADTMNLIRQSLLRHRRPISFVVNGVEMIPSVTCPGFIASGSMTNLGPGFVDSKNGPQVQSCNILNLGEETFILTFHVITWWRENNQINVGVSPTTTNTRTYDVLYNRWTESVELDENMYTRRIREGAYKIRSDTFQMEQADAYRYGMAAVGVPAGFLRESSDYQISPDGLTIRYRVVDKEYFKVPPRPAYKAEGDFTMTLIGPGGAIRYGDVRVRFTGSKNSDQAQLVMKAWAIASNKLMVNGVPIDRKTKRLSTMTNGYIRVGMWDNWVEIHIRAQIMPDKSKTKMEGGGDLLWVKGSDDKESFYRNIVFTPRCADVETRDGSGNIVIKPALEKPPVYYERGSAAWLLQAAAYFDPALNPDPVLIDTDLQQQRTASNNVILPGVEGPNPVIPPGDGPQVIKQGIPIGLGGGIREGGN